MNDGLIPNRYAKALYKYAVENGVAEEVYQQMQQLSDSFAAHKQMQQTVDNPYLSIADKSKVLLAASGANKGGCVDKFITMIIKNNRVNFVRGMALAYQQIYRQVNGIVRVTITTATKVSETLVAEIEKIANARAEGKTLEYVYVVNPDLIGGFTVTMGSECLDASVKNQLEKLRLKLLG